MNADLDRLVSAVDFVADLVVVDGTFRSRAEETRAVLHEALRCALGNGLIQITPVERWPEYLALTPPYTQARGL